MKIRPAKFFEFIDKSFAKQRQVDSNYVEQITLL